MDWKNLTEDELKAAEVARKASNEGRARVCARRAAGHIAHEFLLRQGIQLRNKSALSRIRYLISLPELSPPIKTTLEHFLLHTTPEHNPPIETDLIEDVHWIANELLGVSIK